MRLYVNGLEQRDAYALATLQSTFLHHILFVNTAGTTLWLAVPEVATQCRTIVQ